MKSEDRSSDELIDKALESKIEQMYNEVFEGQAFMYVCTWDGLDHDADDYRVGMMVGIESTDMEVTRVKARKVAIDLGLKWMPCHFAFDDDSEAPEGIEVNPGISWIQYVNDPNEQAIVDWLKEKIADHKG